MLGSVCRDVEGLKVPFTSGEMVVIITTLGTAIVAIITAIRATQVQVKQAVIETKVDSVHELTNSRLSRIEGELKATQQQLTIAMAARQEAESARTALAQEAAARLDTGQPAAHSDAPIQVTTPLVTVETATTTRMPRR